MTSHTLKANVCDSEMILQNACTCITLEGGISSGCKPRKLNLEIYRNPVSKDMLRNRCLGALKKIRNQKVFREY